MLRRISMVYASTGWSSNQSYLGYSYQEPPPFTADKEIELGGKKYKEGYTFVIRVKLGLAIGLMPQNWNHQTDKTEVDSKDCLDYAFVFKRVISGGYCICEVYKDCQYLFDTELPLHLIEDLFTDSVDELRLIKIGYGKLPKGGFKKCSCNMDQLMLSGCSCGSFSKEQEFNKQKKEFLKLLK